MKCVKCDYLMELFEHVPQTNRNYWLMTELFVMLHGGADHCDNTEEKTMEKISIRNAKYAKSGLQDLCDYIGRYIHKYNNRLMDIRMVEIGSYVGDSSEIFAQNIENVLCVDPWKNGYDIHDASSYVHSMEVVEAQFDELLEIYPNIVKIKDTSENIVKCIGDESFDLVYIDGLHTYDGVKKDIKLWLSKVRKGGFIAGHDYNNKHHPGVKPAVDETLGLPDETFKDTSWIKQIK